MISYSDEAIRFSGPDAENLFLVFGRFLPTVNGCFELHHREVTKDSITAYYKHVSKTDIAKIITLMEVFLDKTVTKTEDLTLVKNPCCPTCGAILKSGQKLSGGV